MAEPVRKPSKPWRVTHFGATTGYRTERAAYEAVNELAANAERGDAGKRFTVERWEDGQWRLYERGILTGSGWEPA
jgi:hypothetical protein